MKHIIFDCDNTFGVKGCDVDDGLALLYLLGCEKKDVPEVSSAGSRVKLHGITATYGNNRIDVVCETIHRMLKDIGREDITVSRGGSGAGDYDSEASSYLAEMADRFSGQLSILATGSLTNLKGAYEKDRNFFEKVKEIVLMGGITKPLIFEKKVMQELNFSCDARASCDVLKYGKNVSVITGNNCLKVLFTKEEYKKELFLREEPAARYIREQTDDWFGYNETDYGIKGFYNWDVTAAVYLTHPELFTEHKYRFDFSEEDLRTGYLKRDAEGVWECNLPEIREEKAFKRNIYDTWMRVEMKEG